MFQGSLDVGSAVYKFFFFPAINIYISSTYLPLLSMCTSSEIPSPYTTDISTCGNLLSRSSLAAGNQNSPTTSATSMIEADSHDQLSIRAHLGNSCNHSHLHLSAPVVADASTASRISAGELAVSTVRVGLCIAVVSFLPAFGLSLHICRILRLHCPCKRHFTCTSIFQAA